MKPFDRSASETCTLDSSSEPPARSSFMAGCFCIRRRSSGRTAKGLHKSGSRGGLRLLFLAAVYWPPDCQLGSRKSGSHPSQHLAGRDSPVDSATLSRRAPTTAIRPSLQRTSASAGSPGPLAPGPCPSTAGFWTKPGHVRPEQRINPLDSGPRIHFTSNSDYTEFRYFPSTLPLPVFGNRCFCRAPRAEASRVGSCPNTI